MRFTYAITYVPDVEAALAFYESAFGFQRAYLDPSGLYGALKTGETTIAFVAYEQANTLGTGYAPIEPGSPPPGIEMGFATEDVDRSYAAAVAAGATPVSEPADKPWGERIAYVRDLNGLLIEMAQKSPAST